MAKDLTQAVIESERRKARNQRKAQRKKDAKRLREINKRTQHALEIRVRPRKLTTNEKLALTRGEAVHVKEGIVLGPGESLRLRGSSSPSLSP